jgi:hypothetical protein
MTKNKATTAIAISLILAFAISIVALPSVTAQSTRETYAFISGTPNPAGVGQPVLLHVGISHQLQQQRMGWEGLTVTVTKPNGDTETLGPIRTDATGGTGYVYIPDQVGNYTLQTHFPEQVTTADKYATDIPAGTVMQASDSEKITLVVQEEHTPNYPSVPLPTEYWTRPINGQNWAWSSISGNWLTPQSLFYTPSCPDNNAPESAHILWAKPLNEGGLPGGNLTNANGQPVQYEEGAAYEGKFRGSVIISGILYYNQFGVAGGSGGGALEQGIVAVDLHTGQQLWVLNNTRLAFGQVFYWDSYNMHGVFSYLWETVGSQWNAYDPLTGAWVYSMTNVPSGTQVYGPKGEIYRYNVNTAHDWMTLWNSSRVGSSEGSWGRSVVGKTLDASRGIEWNITIPDGLPGSAQAIILGDRVFGGAVSNTEVDSWAFSLKPGQEGQLLYNHSWAAPSDWAAGGISVRLNSVSLDDGVFIVTTKETRQHWGFSTTSGEKLWGPTEPQNYLDMYQDCNGQIVDHIFLSGTMSGILSCYNVSTGELMWTHATSDVYNEMTWSNNYPRRNPAMFVSDGKVYTASYEHSPINPLARGTPIECLNETTGELIWSLPLYEGSYYNTALIGDSIIATFNGYDNRIYALGKGPSTTTVEAPMNGIKVGDSITIQGTVTDISPGTQEYALTARFPNGVPAVSDASQTGWMQYLYYQFPRPSNATGVEVTLSVIDANNNYRDIGTTTSDADGFFSYAWQPDIPGKYTVIATFGGSNAYYPSHAETAFFADPAPEATAAPTPSPASMSDMYFLPMSVGLIIAIVVVIALLAMVLLRKRA